VTKEEPLIELLREVKDILDEHNVEFWLECGTLLGAVRDGKFIPWEEDLDFGAWQEQLPKPIKDSIAKAFKNKGFRIWVTENCITVKNSEKAFADINFYHLVGNNAVVYRKEPKNLIGLLLYMFYKTLLVPYYYKIDLSKGRKVFVRSIFVILSRMLPLILREKIAERAIAVYDNSDTTDVSWVVPSHYITELSTMNFLGMQFNIPAKTEEYLAYRYGQGWRTPRQDWITTRDDGAVNKKIFDRCI